MSHADFPEGFALCPKCHGSCRIPATGEWKSVMAGNCYHVYTCTKCGSSYDIDSGD